jgi:hypothetical protein
MLTGVGDIDNQVLTSNSMYRQYYLSFDVNLNAIRINSKLLQSIFDFFNMIKIPLPTLEISKNRGVFHLFCN